MATRKPQPTKLHRTLHLQHKAHTGRMLHHKHTSYRGLAIIVVLAGVFMIGLNAMARATADTITVTAQLLAAIPTDPAVITSPASDITVAKSRLTVAGTCPQMTGQGTIGILDNGVLIGSVACDADNTFSLEVQVHLGINKLVARTYTITNQYGPDSAPVTVTYLSPTPLVVVPPDDPTADSRTYKNDLIVVADKAFILFSPELDGEWAGTITGGALPYEVNFDWGDGSSNTYTVTKSGHQSFSHHYTSMQLHDVFLRVHDADGRSVEQEYAAITSYHTPISSIFYTSPPKHHYQTSVPLTIYGTYLIVIAGFGILWLMASPASFAYARLANKQLPRLKRPGLHHAARKKHS